MRKMYTENNFLWHATQTNESEEFNQRMHLLEFECQSSSNGFRSRLELNLAYFSISLSSTELEKLQDQMAIYMY